MKKYEKAEPLIAIHIPKTGGSSVKEVFKGWFNEGIYLNYYDEIKGQMPTKLDFSEIHRRDRQICIYGHFNSKRGFGIRDYYPEAKQFVTIMREPFELAVSTFFFLNKVSSTWKDRSRTPTGDLRQYLSTYTPNVLNHFPADVTTENYKELIEEYFICVGITELMDDSIKLLAEKLGFPVPATIEFRNRTERTEPVPGELTEEFMERWTLEYRVYEYARDRLASQISVLGHQDEERT